MRKKEFRNSEKSIPVAICAGTVISFVSMIIGVMIITLLLSNETIAEAVIGYAVLLTTLISVVVGTVVTVLLVKSRVFVLSLCTSSAFFLLLLALTAMFFGGQYSGVPATLLVIIGGSVGVALITAKYLYSSKSYRKKR